MIIYKIDIMQALKKKGYTSYKLRKEKLFGESTIQKFRDHGNLNFNDLNKLCDILDCDISDIIEYKKE